MIRIPLLLLGLLLGWSGTAFAADYKAGALEISQTWARATPRSAPAGGAYLTIHNTGTTPDKLVTARSAVAGLVQVHEMKMEGDVMKMRELENGLPIPAGATVTLAPGGIHLMMMGLKEPLEQNTKFTISLTFEKAGKIDVEVPVEGMGATKPPAGK